MSIIDEIGNTPLIRLEKFMLKPGVRLFAKMEAANPGGSVKDRPALCMIERAEERGVLTREKTIIEATSGNTGIALAMIGAAKGYDVTIVMPACASEERRHILEAYGANVVLTAAAERTDGAIRKAQQMAEAEPSRYFMPDQFGSEDNWLSHYETTGPEIWEQMKGDVDVFVAGLGTTGTIMGVGKYLKEMRPDVRIVGVEPPEGHTIQGLKNMSESMVPGIFDRDRLDDVITIGDEAAFETAKLLATSEGLFVGMSSGAAVAGALKIASKLEKGNIVTLLPDKGDRYLSTNLFRSVCAECPP